MIVSPSERAQFGLTLVFLGPFAAHAADTPIASLCWCPHRKAYPRFSTRRWDIVGVSANGGRHKILLTTVFRFRDLLQ